MNDGSRLLDYLRWTLGPLKYVIASPMFGCWHQTVVNHGDSMNFASTLPVWDLVSDLPKNKLPDAHNIDDQSFPESIGAQLLYPFGRWKPRLYSSFTILQSTPDLFFGRLPRSA